MKYVITNSKAKRGLCSVKFCRRRRARQRTTCLTCKSRLWRKANPIRALYINLKSHAKARGHEFTLTFAQWRAFCLRTDYHKLKGLEPDSLTVERKDEARGYHADNLTVLKHSENVRRGFVPAFACPPPRGDIYGGGTPF